MVKLADHSLSELVRKVLPRPKSDEDWRVELTDLVDCISADRSGHPVVRVHTAWRETIYDRGLAHVTRHYPLALEPRGNQDVPLLRSAQHLSLWRGKAIKRIYKNGNFTGRLRLVPVFVARTFDGLGLHADSDAETAAKAALTERRSKLKQEELKKRHVAKLRNKIHETLRERVQSAGVYDGNYRVALAPYKNFLPLAQFLARSDDTVPLIVVENECVDAVLNMQCSDVLTLFHQLAIDTAAARASFAALTDEDESALMQFARAF